MLTVIIAGAILVIVGAVLIGGFGETLDDCSFHLEASDQVLQVGESVTLTLTVTPDAPRTVDLSEYPHAGVRIAPMAVGRLSALPPLHNTGKKVRHTFSPGEPLVFEVTGVAMQDETGDYFRDFGDWGPVDCDRRHVAQVWASVMPYRIEPASSVEWGTSNRIGITIVPAASSSP